VRTAFFLFPLQNRLTKDITNDYPQIKMKEMARRIPFLLLLLLVNSLGFSQIITTNNMRASASVVQPITINKAVDLNSESVAIIIAGSVELVPTESQGSATSIMVPVTTGTFTAASFFLSGTTAYTYKVSVPASPVEVKSGGRDFVVRSFDSDPILNKDSDLLAGVHVMVSSMNVTVNYN
jgi:hypothetical protein